MPRFKAFCPLFLLKIGLIGIMMATNINKLNFLAQNWIWFYSYRKPFTSIFCYCQLHNSSISHTLPSFKAFCPHILFKLGLTCVLMATNKNNLNFLGELDLILFILGIPLSHATANYGKTKTVLKIYTMGKITHIHRNYNNPSKIIQ